VKETKGWFGDHLVALTGGPELGRSKPGIDIRTAVAEDLSKGPSQEDVGWRGHSCTATFVEKDCCCLGPYGELLEHEPELGQLRERATEQRGREPVDADVLRVELAKRSTASQERYTADRADRAVARSNRD
jgi:hypothetical protein